MDNIFINYSLLILVLPLVAFVILIFAGKRLPRQGDWVAVSAILVTLILSIVMFVAMLLDYNPVFSQESTFTWMDLGAFKIELGILVDNITIIMLLVVTLISSCSHIFSLKYMEGDIRYSRYYAYLGLFTFSMNGIVLSNNLISMYMSWELVGLSSYLLIGHWFEKDSAADAGKKAFIVNRIGDFGFLLGILLVWSSLDSINFEVLGNTFMEFAQHPDRIPDIWDKVGMAAGLLIFCGAVGKSAQFPLHVWLPDAM
ncbi:MAG: NADH-quinone oxidoreductase subunit L, partial [Candidatus Marinimicrobia bacterium]|nr:NADH-quinone oxidoreductase subunit L [Candidatus Neomarinimicrobiota bacterium]